MLLLIFGTCAVAVIAWLVLKPDPEPLYGVYAQPGKWSFLKRCLFYLMFKLREYKTKQNAAKNLQGVGYGVKSKKDPTAMECPQELSPKEKDALDAVYFNGFNKDGVSFIMRIGRRLKREAELWLSIKVPGMGFYQSPVHPDTKVYNTDGKGFNVGGLRFECLEPHKKWTISFNGMLREDLCNTWSDRDKGKLVHVKFSFHWETFSDVFDFDTDLDPWLLGHAIAREKWTNEFWSKLVGKHQTHYEQWGEMKGVLNVEGKEEMKLYLRSCRDHSYGVRDWCSFHRYMVHLGVLEDGSTFHISEISLPLTTSHMQCGYFNRPNSVQHAVTSVDLDMPSLGEDGNPPQSWTFNFTAGGKQYHVEVKGHTTPIYYHGRDWGNIIHEMMCDFTVNGKKGWGITEFCYRKQGGDCPVPHQESVPMLRAPDSLSAEDETALVLTFCQPPCCSSRLVGGKGCQLAMLTQMKEHEESAFIVPSGFCLTLAAFAWQLKVNKTLDKQLADLTDIACGKKTGELKDACDKTVAMFLETSLCQEIQECIEKYLKCLFPDDWQQLGFAVRSSAAGEDSEEMSAAGQMETILGVKGLQQIFDAVKKCWSSHFSFTAVEYRRQHGQPIHSLMGVVIQKMVQADAAGVLFTRDPMTGNPQYMTLNANYGLGESVVSGSSEPDLITIKRDHGDKLEIVNREIGSKKTQITTTELGGTIESEVSTERTNRCCVSDDVVLQLARVGIELEKSFSDPRDIEWAVAGSQIYLLQARPITTLDQETEEELMHEFDTPLCTDKEMMTRYNIGEVMPGVLTPLGLTTVYFDIEKCLQGMLVEAGVHSHIRPYFKFMGVFYNQGFINMSFMQGLYEGNIFGHDKKMAEVSICGEPIKDFPLEDVVEYNGAFPLYARLWHACKHWKNMLGAFGRTKQWAERLKTYKLPLEGCDAQQTYDVLVEKSIDSTLCWGDHLLNSSASAAWASVLMNIMTGGALKWDPQHYADVAMLLSKCDDVYSADVPAALKNVTTVLRKSNHAEKFACMESEEALQWLKSDESGEAGQRFADFMAMHGHRCIRECEIHEKSWQSEPSKIIKSLQAMLRAPDSHDSSSIGVEDVGEAIAQLQTPTTVISRQILKFVLPRARKAVGAREWGKATAVRLIEHFKQGYWKLARLMVEEGRLPDADLLFYLTRTEIGRLLETRSGRLIARAQKRRRLEAKLGALEFPLLQRNHPQPIVDEEEEEDYVITSFKATGTPVSQGAIKGTARIVKSLDNAHFIQAGDILVVKTTDVGWSPYFPLISGLVTEMGGLLSHGAVVAREYGIPCVVNVNRATSIFKSGEKVLLNGTKGTFEKLEE